MPRAKPATPTKHPDAAPALAALTEADITLYTDAQSFSRGRTYARDGRIYATVRHGDTLSARCRGDSGGPYRVTATLELADPARRGKRPENPRLVGCDCPRGGFCKHVVALLLTWIAQPEVFAARPGLSELLAAKSKADLIAVIEVLAGDDPDLADRLPSLLALPLPGAGDPSRAPVDEAAIRRQIEQALPDPEMEWDYDHGGYGDDDYGYGGGVSPDLERLVGLGETYTAAGDWPNALRVFATFAESVAPDFEQLAGYDEEGELIELVRRCDQGLAAILAAQAAVPRKDRLPASARERLIDAIFEIWEADLEAGGLDASAAGPEAIGRHATAEEKHAISAQVRYWIKPAAANDVTRQHRTRDAIWFLSLLGGEAGLSDEDLLAEYQAAGLWEEAAHTLLKLGRVEDAIALAAQRLTAAPQLLQFAEALLATDDPPRVDQALTLVEESFWEREGQQPRQDAALSAWLEAQFGARGRPDRALALARRGFARAPGQQTYDAVRTAALLPDQPDAPWPGLRQELLTDLRKRGDWDELIEIFLAEAEVADAITAYKQREATGRAMDAIVPAWGGESVADRVAAAAERDFPDEAIRLYWQLAEHQITGRNRTHYHTAAEYLVRVKTLMTAADRGTAWVKLITALRQQHQTLPALQDELNQRGLE